MKLKKILSLISALAIATTSFATVAFAREPYDSQVTFGVSTKKITASDFEGLAKKWQTLYNKEGKEAYFISVTVDGLNLSSTMDWDNWAVDGRALVGAKVELEATNTYKWGSDFKYEAYSSEYGEPKGNPTDTPTINEGESVKYYGASYNSSDPIYPTADMLSETDDGAMTVTSLDGNVMTFIMFVDPAKPVDLTITGNVMSLGFDKDGAKTNSDGMHTASPVEITLPEVTNVPVESISLNKSTTTITEGQTETLVATVLPEGATDKTVTWSSDDTDVATVVDGVVTAVAPGEATITATAGEESATCVVTVKAAKVDVTSVTLNKSTTTLTVGETETLEATVLPANATNPTVTWSSDDTDVATVVDGVVTAVKAGTATITATADGQSATCVVTVNNPAPQGVQIDMPDQSANSSRYYHETDKGYVWNIIVSNYLKNEVLSATFTSSSAAEPKVQKLPIGGLADGEGSFSFDIILKTTKNDVTLNVAEVK